MEDWIYRYPKAQGVFSDLPLEDLLQLEVIKLKPQQALMMQDAVDDNALYYVLSGVLEGKQLYADNHMDGVYYAPIKVKKDSFTGFVEAVYKTPTQRTVSIFAKSDVEALKIPRSFLVKWAVNNTNAFFNIVGTIMQSAWGQRKVITTYNQQCSSVRLAFHLVYLYQVYLESCYPNDYTGYVKIMDTRNEIGSITGHSTRTIDRNIGILKEKKLLSQKLGKILINKAQYNELCHFIEAKS